MELFTKVNGEMGNLMDLDCSLASLMRSLSVDSMAGKSLMDRPRFCLRMANITKANSNKTCATTPVLITTRIKTFMKDPGIMIAAGAKTVDVSGSKMEVQSMLSSSLTWLTVMLSLMTKRATSSCLKLKTPKT